MNHRIGSRARAGAFVSTLVVLALAVAAGPAGAATVTSVTGSAYGYQAFNIVLLGSSLPPTGPTPIVTMASNASNSPQAASATTGLVQYGPAVLFTSDRIDVSTSGSLGGSGSVTSTTNIRNINKALTQPNTGGEIFTTDNLSSTCTASISGTSRITRVTNGILQTDSGRDINDDGDYIDPGEHAPVNVTVPAVPAANATYSGHLHLSGGASDNFTVVFNEQVTNPNGSVTVNAVHEYFLGPSLRGDLIIGSATCGVVVS